jgi:hypothetical protein
MADVYDSSGTWIGDSEDPQLRRAIESGLVEGNLAGGEEIDYSGRGDPLTPGVVEVIYGPGDPVDAQPLPYPDPNYGLLPYKGPFPVSPRESYPQPINLPITQYANPIVAALGSAVIGAGINWAVNQLQPGQPNPGGTPVPSPTAGFNLSQVGSQVGSWLNGLPAWAKALIAAGVGAAAVAGIVALVKSRTGSPTGQIVVPGGKTVVKTWTANNWPFVMTSDGWIYTINKSGVTKGYKPHKPIVLVRGHLNIVTAVKAQRYLDQQWRILAKRTKQLKLA